MEKFRPSGIRKGLKFLVNHIHCSYVDLESELKDYRKKTASEEKFRREKRRNNLEKIRNEEFVFYVFIVMMKCFVFIFLQIKVIKTVIVLLFSLKQRLNFYSFYDFSNTLRAYLIN